MQELQAPGVKKSSKTERQLRVLLALVEQHIRTGKPIGSHTLKEADFTDLSSATIRNYFACLEEQGFLTQPHASGGRLPTHSAYRLYAQSYRESEILSPQHAELCRALSSSESREIAAYLQKAGEELSSAANAAVFLSAPRFDHDFIIGIRLVSIDTGRCLCILITDFGLVHTELLYISNKLSAFAVRRIEEYFQWRLNGVHKPENLEEEEEQTAQTIYNEIMLRYLVGYSNFTDEELYRTGFSKLLHYPEFQEAKQLSTSLALFENTHSMRLLLRECTSRDQLKIWIGDDLSPYTHSTPECCAIAIPYHVNQRPIGAIGLLTPLRVSYKELFGLLRALAHSVTTALTRNLCKYKIKYRQPHEGPIYLQKENHHLVGHSQLFLLEDQRPKPLRNSS